MRSVRIVLAFCVLIFAIPSWGQQAPQPAQTASTSQPASDPQAVALVQAAITALGGATAIGQAQSWTFQAQMQGPHANGPADYIISTDTNTGQHVRADGTMRPAHLIRSHFIPALVGAILLRESADSDLLIRSWGQSTVDSKPVTVIAMTIGKSGFPAQTWAFDRDNLPVQIDFLLPAEIGARRSLYGFVHLSNYRSVSGVLYPFRIVSFDTGRPPQITMLQSVSAGAAAPMNEFNGLAGDLR